ncbi:MAG TPA: hypothetical protein VG122_23360 [Gemmata sp.]|jgi:hypothetical protein|nr:hypothetical protein [Gemmata sp.]
MVKVINLNDQDETVKQFFESLVPDPDGAMVELNDRRVFILVRPAQQMDQADEPWTDAKNHRRSDLVDREIDGTLTAVEAAELDNLQRQMIRYVDRVAPLPLEEARKLHQQLLEKARAATSTGNEPA